MTDKEKGLKEGLEQFKNFFGKDSLEVNFYKYIYLGGENGKNTAEWLMELSKKDIARLANYDQIYLPLMFLGIVEMDKVTPGDKEIFFKYFKSIVGLEISRRGKFLKLSKNNNGDYYPEESSNKTSIEMFNIAKDISDNKLEDLLNKYGSYARFNKYDSCAKSE